MEPITEVKDAIRELGSTFEQFKAANDERLKQIEEKGKADPLLEEKICKMSEAMDTLSEIKERLEKAETAIKRTAQDTTAGGSDEPAEMREYKEAFVRYMRKGVEDNLKELQIKGLSVGVDTEGGYLVRPEVASDIIKNITETTPMRQIARVRSIGTDAFEQLRQTSGAASGGWVSETGARNETAAPKLGVLRIPVHEQYAAPHATQQFLDDENVNVEQWLSEEVADVFQRTENTAFVSGNGVGKPRGILDYPAGTADGQIEQVNSGSAGAVTGDGLITLQAALKEPYQANATWLMNRLTVRDIMLLKDANGQYIWRPGLVAGQPDLLLGRPIVKGSDMPTPAANALAIVYGDFRRGYWIIDRVGIRVLRDPYTAKPYVEFYTTKRTGGGVMVFEALKIQKLAV